jgi:L-erythrulose 1-phosphate isomerase
MAKLNKIYLGTNTKMYKTIFDTIDFLSELDSLTADIDRRMLELFVIPSFTSLEAARKCVPADKITLGAQNMCWEDKGQFTGEISPIMLKEVGVKIVEIGHSERRHVLRETDAEENKKVLAALNHGFTALLCIGETEEQKKQGISDEVLRIQLKTGLYGVTPKLAEHLWVAYEPVWAIGANGTPASKEYADEKHAVIKRTLAELFGEEVGGGIPALYGGSVNNENANELIAMPHIDGLFIGRSAWNAKNFNTIIRAVMPLFFNKGE